jgi:DNA polymerase-3 subunit delta
MKIQFRQIENFVRNPGSDVPAILVYGPDRGLVKERMRMIARTVVEDYNDPFNVAVLTSARIEEDAACLFDEASALSMMGGRRLVRIEDGSEKIVPAMKEYLKNAANSEACLILVEGGELSPRSSLRGLFEKDKRAAALPCYVEDERDLAGSIRSWLSEQGYRAAPDAVQWLAASLQGDRQRARTEIDKLMLYMGEAREIGIEHARLCCGEAGEASIETLVYAVGGRDTKTALGALSRITAEGIPFVVVLRALQTHFRRLHLVKSRMSGGQSMEEAMSGLQPPIFFKLQPPFKAQASRWPLNTLESILTRLSDIEAQCKKTGAPVDTLCAQTVLGLSRMG